MIGDNGEYKSEYFPDRHLMLTGFEHQVMNAIINLEMRVNALEAREIKYTVALED